jgi:hypothetical protein
MENKWAVFLGNLARMKLPEIDNLEQAKSTIESNNQNCQAVLKNLMKRVSTRGGFFETLHLSLTHMSKLTLKGLKDLLKTHSLDEADKMANIRPDLLATLRSAIS